MQLVARTDFQQSDWRFQIGSILETLNEGVVIVDENLQPVFVNDTILHLSGYERGELLNSRLDSFFSPDDLAYLMQQHNIAQQHGGRHRHEFQMPRKAGGCVPVIMSGRIITGSEGRMYSVITITDIGEQKRVEEELRQANAQLELRQREIEEELALAASVQQSLAPASLVWGRVAIEAHYFLLADQN